NAHVADLPGGDPAPPDGALPAAAVTGLGELPFGVYVHVPFCATRCGYCDFNTYTPGELGTAASSSWLPSSGLQASWSEAWLAALRRELDLAVTVLGEPVPADTVFVGGGTPSLLGTAG